MNRRTALNLALAAALAVAIMLIAGRGTPPPTEDAAFPLVAVAPDAVTTIEYRRNGLPAVRLVRRGDAWRVTEPLPARADSSAVAGLLALAAATSASRMPAGELVRFELDKPWASVKLEGHDVDFGASNPLTREIYVASSGYVHVLPTRAAAALPDSLGRLLDKRLFGPSEQPTGWRFASFSVTREAGRWRLASQSPAGISQDDLAAWAQRWREAVALDVRPMPASLEGERVDIDLDGGGRVALLIVQREPEPLVVRLGEGLAYRLPRSGGQALLAAPGAATRD